jgi:hypothetical protein
MKMPAAITVTAFTLAPWALWQYVKTRGWFVEQKLQL